MQKSEVIKILKTNKTMDEKADEVMALIERETKRAKDDALAQSDDAGQIIRKVEVNTGDDKSQVVSHASSYGMHVGLDEHGRAREVSFDRGARVVNASNEGERPQGQEQREQR